MSTATAGSTRSVWMLMATAVDDALADLDGDGVADHAVLDGQSYFTDDGSGTWAVSVDRGGQLRWFGLDGVEHSGGPLIEYGGGPTVDLNGDGQADDRLLDTDGNGLADRTLGGGVGYVDTDGDGRWDIKLDRQRRRRQGRRRKRPVMTAGLGAPLRPANRRCRTLR